MIRDQYKKFNNKKYKFEITPDAARVEKQAFNFNSTMYASKEKI